MKKQGVPILVAVTLGFLGFTFGFFLGKTRAPEPVILSVPASAQVLPAETTSPSVPETLPEPMISFPIDLNLAGKDEFMALPGIGEVLAQRILDYREEQGSFSCIEELMYVEGIGKLRMEKIFDLVTIGG